MTQTLAQPTVVRADANARPAAAFSPSLTRTIPAVFLRRLCAANRALCLTFDDGPGPALTRELLALLAIHNARATFFALGIRAEEAPDILDLASSRGHEICCHTRAHKNAWRTRAAAAVADIDAGYATLARWVPAHGFFRPPYGKMSPGTIAAIRRRGVPVGWWTIDGGDTHTSLPSASKAVDALARCDGGVVLLHDFDRARDAATRARYVLDMVEALLRTAAREGMRVWRLGDLFGGNHHSIVMNRPARILAISSGGGHWVQLLRLGAAFEGHDVTYATVNAAYRADIPSGRFYVVRDATRWNKLGLLVMLLQVGLIILRVRPGVIISTGAAPGFMALRIGRLLGIRTVWIDSIANVERLSLCGEKIGTHADLWLTQWPHLADPAGPLFLGAVV